MSDTISSTSRSEAARAARRDCRSGVWRRLKPELVGLVGVFGSLDIVEIDDGRFGFEVAI